MSKSRFGKLSRFALVAALLLGACGGESTRKGAPSNASGATGGTTATATGGSDAAGGDNGVSGATGGGGVGGGGVGGTSVGGTSVGGSSAGGSGGDGNTGSGGSLTCAKVNCPSIPASCKRIVQNPGDCCPTCPDTGCSACPDIVCADGTHSEMVAGDCCPSCVMDPPDACETGQADYANLRMALLDKYGSSGCSNSTDCTIVIENNACNVTCGVALPSSTATNFTDNLARLAPGCATCPMPAAASCTGWVPACVNGRCLAVNWLQK